MRTLFGGDNKDWSFTPLQKIYDYFVAEKNSKAFEKSAIDVGALLREVLEDDVRWSYEMIQNRTNEYRRLK